MFTLQLNSKVCVQLKKLDDTLLFRNQRHCNLFAVYILIDLYVLDVSVALHFVPSFKSILQYKITIDLFTWYKLQCSFLFGIFIMRILCNRSARNFPRYQHLTGFLNSRGHHQHENLALSPVRGSFNTDNCKSLRWGNIVDDEATKLTSLDIFKKSSLKYFVIFYIFHSYSID